MLKLLNYGQPDPFRGTIGKSLNLAWPVNAYRVTLPRTFNRNDGLNSFERVILNLLDAVGTIDARALADETRIPLDLVKCILLRLQDKALIDEHNDIIKQKRDDITGDEEQTPVFVTALVFRELATGKILPYLHMLDSVTPLKKQNEEDVEKKRPKKIDSNNKYEKQTPTAREIIIALRAMKKRSAAFGGVNAMPAAQQIIIANSPEPYHLDCPIAIQKSDGEFRIADPFGNGFSLTLERALNQLLEQDDKSTTWLLNWKKSLDNPHSSNKDTRPKEAFEIDSNWQRYPKLIASLRPAQNMPFRSISQIHASIEWALFYACRCRPSESVIKILKLTMQEKHAVLLAETVRTIGLVPPKSGFRPIREGKLIDFQNEKAELETVLAIAVLQASSDPSHPLRRIAASHTDFIARLFDIKNKRNEKAHGKGGADAPEKELSDDPFMREIIHALVPEIVFVDTPAVAQDDDIRADSLLDARTSLQNEFGFKIFNSLGENLQERLVHAERFWLSCNDGDVENAIGFVRDLCAAVQAVFEMAMAGILPPDVDDTQLIKLAEKKAIDFGLCSHFPDSLSRVKPSTIRQTLQGLNQTLGACVISFLLMANDDTLRTLSDSQPSFLNDVVGLIKRRGHGNEVLRLSKNELKVLRKSAFLTIKTLMES